MTCPGTTKVEDVIKFIETKLPLQKYIITSGRNFDALQHIEVVIPVRIEPKQVQEILPAFDYYIPLNNDLELAIIYKLLWPLTGCMEPGSGSINLRYR